MTVIDRYNYVVESSLQIVNALAPHQILPCLTPRQVHIIEGLIVQVIAWFSIHILGKKRKDNSGPQQAVEGTMNSMAV